MSKRKTVVEVIQEELEVTSSIDWDRVTESERRYYIQHSIKRIRRFIRRDIPGSLGKREGYQNGKRNQH